ncbi:GspH/FimT family pseudopilin [uncultured Roseovarius sp.]|uniref:GspH/FimT family pseudopilin n=1 Tax=uncultured Roseovarius sp. TaxID=293344 RepID=UPI00262CBAE5|nr:GspH/FimT family pseudopilin [uncultured Roseovarius sp.]
MGRVKPASDRGFSLLEMVVVVAVIAVLSVTATFAITDRSRGEGDERRFAAAYDRLRDAAILGQQPQGLTLVPGGWLVLVPPAPDALQGGWLPFGKKQKFRGEARFDGPDGAVLPQELPRVPRPDFVFLPDGQVSTFEVTFIGNETISRCRSAGVLGLECEDA